MSNEMNETELFRRNIDGNERKNFFHVYFVINYSISMSLMILQRTWRMKESLRIITVSVRFTVPPSIKLRCLDN